MTPRIQTLFFLLLIIMSITALHAYASIVPLEYQYSGSNVYPGAEVQVQMYAQAARWVTGYSMAPVALKVGDVEIAIDGEAKGRGVDVFFIVKDGGNVVDKVDLPDPGFFEKKQYDLAIDLRWNCDSSNLEIGVSGAVNKHYSLDPGDPPAKIWYYSSRAGGITSPDVESSVTVGGSKEFANCWDGPGDGSLPKPGDGSHAGGNTKGKASGNSNTTLLYLGLGMVGLGIFLMLRGGRR